MPVPRLMRKTAWWSLDFDWPDRLRTRGLASSLEATFSTNNL